MPLTQTWENPEAIWLLIFILFNFYLKTGSRIWRAFRAREINQTLVPGEKLPSVRPLIWRLSLAMLISFGISCIGPFLSTPTTTGQFFILSLATILALGIGVNRYAFTLIERYQLIPQKTLKNLTRNKVVSVFTNSIMHPVFGNALMVLLILAIMSPLGPEKTTRLKRVPFQLAVLLDLSASMDATDLKPSRLEHAKDELIHLLEQSTSDEISLVYFSDHAFIQAPLTVDHKTLQSFVRHASSDFMPSQGSDIGLALSKAAESFNKSTVNSTWKSREQMQRIVLFTDGEDHGDRLEASLKQLKEEKIHVDVIGFGSDGGAQLLDPNGLPLLYKGMPVISHYNDVELEHIASETGGLYFRYTKPELSIKALSAQYETIRAKMQPSGGLSSIYRTQLYPLFLYPAYFLYLMLIIFPITILSRKAYRCYRKKHGKQLTIFLIILACLGSSCDIPLPYEDDISLQKLKTAISQGRYVEAQELLELAQSKASSRDDDALAINEAVLMTALDKCTEARHKLLGIRNRSHAKHLDIAIYLQLAEAAICEAQIDEAKQDSHYAYAIEQLSQAASLGADTAGRIAQILSLWIPSCTSFQDERLQKADKPESAISWQDWQALAKPVLCPKRSLWIALPVREYENISMTASFESLERKFWPDDGSKLPYSQISLSLYASDARGVPNPEPFITTAIPLPKGSIKASDFKHIDKEVPAFTVGAQQSVYYIKLETLNNGEASVYLDLKRRLDCAKLDDLHTYSQDLIQSPLLLTADSTYSDLILCPKRPDAFLFELEAGSSAIISIMFLENKKPKLHLKIDGKSQTIDDQLEANNPHRLIEPQTAPDRDDLKSDADEFRLVPWLLHLHNSEQSLQKYELLIAPENEAIDYDFRFARSYDCKDSEAKTTYLPLPLPQTLKSQKPVVIGPKWICSNEELNFEPVFDKKGKQAISVNIIATIIAQIPLREDAIKLSKKLRISLDDKSSQMLIAEDSEAIVALWKNADNIRRRRLSRPLTDLSIVHFKNMDTAGFYALSVENRQENPPSDNKDDDEKSENQKKDGQSQEDDETPQDKPSEEPDPQEKSNEPSTPEGPGTDTQGDASTPDPKADNKNASQFDPEAFERDKIDALLDDIERGNFLAPIEGMTREEPTSDKNW